MHFGSILSMHEEHFRFQLNFLHDMVIETNYPQQQAKRLYVVNECNEKWSWECTLSNGTKGRNRF